MDAPEQLAVCSFGGLISIDGETNPAGETVELTAGELVQAHPTLNRFGEICTFSVANGASPSVSFVDVLRGLQWCMEQARRGVKGIVISHGTDTLEETAYLLDLLWPFSIPLVFTGAMRSPLAPGADGPANLVDACTVAASPAARDLGVLVTMNGRVDYAARVTKADTVSVEAFTSPGYGPAGRVIESEFELYNLPASTRPESLPIPEKIGTIPILEPGLGCDGSPLFSLIRSGEYRGIVLAGMGAGDVPTTYLDAIHFAIKRSQVVVMASRVGAGRRGCSAAMKPGLEIDLQTRGVVFAGSLSPVKARILLSVLLSLNVDMQTLRRQFEERGK